MSLLNVLKDFAAKTPNTVFLFEGAQKQTYSETFNLSKQMASGLSKMGVEPGDRVILALHNCLDFCTALYGIQWAGAIAVLVNPRWTTFEIENAFKLTRPKLVVGDPANPALKSQMWQLHSTRSIVEQGTSNFEQRMSPDDLCAMLMTSGTTGKPKAAMLTHKSVFANASQLAKRKELTPKDRFLCSIPMFHSNGHTAALQSMLVAGASLVLLDKFTPEGLLEAATRYECTAISGVPTLYQHLVNYFSNNPIDLSKLRICVSGGAPMPVSLFHEVEEKFKAYILEGYGLTETSAGACGTPLNNRKIGSVGPALDNTEIKIVNDQEKELPIGETGEIFIRGPQLMRGYFEDPVSTKAALTDDGWLRSGDLGTMDEDGFITIKSRKKELIIRSGFNVYPAEVENVLRSIDGIQDVTVLGLPDPLHGEAVHAAVISDLPEGELTQRLRKYSESMLARYKRPTSFSLHKDFPKTGSTKVQKTGVVAQLKEKPALVKPL